MQTQPMQGLVYPVQLKPEIWVKLLHAAFVDTFYEVDDCTLIPEYNENDPSAWTTDNTVQGTLRTVQYTITNPVTDPKIIITRSLCVQKMAQVLPPMAVGYHQVNPLDRLYHPSVAADPHSRHTYGYAVPSSWMADNGTAGTLWLEGMDKPMTPLMGAVQFFCSWVDDLELDESVADIERIVAVAANYDDLFILQRGEYLPLEYLPVRDNHALEALEAWTQATITHLNEMLDK